MNQQIADGQATLGIELGSTRIKAVLVDPEGQILAQGAYEWENQLIDGYWTYSLDEVWRGIQAAYRDLSTNVAEQYNVALTKLRAIGISAMMHGYLAFDSEDQLLVPFRTWRNTSTGEASLILSELFQFNIPQRWSVAHLYQAILAKEPHIHRIAYMTTLAGYVHWQLTGEKVLGIGDAAGMFPISNETLDFDPEMLAKFDALPDVPFALESVMPHVLLAGVEAGRLTAEGAKKLDPTGQLEAGALFCPPEGDAGTGMTATNTVAKRSGNVSVGTSIFAMVVLEGALAKHYEEIDMVTTPDGKPVAMVHCNNGTSEADNWVRIFGEFAALLGNKVDKSSLYEMLYQEALKGDPQGVVSFNYLAGEPITGTTEGRPLYLRLPDKRMSLADFMLAQLFSIVATLKLGMAILTEEESVEIDLIVGHGGVFKTPEVMQKIMASALGIPTAVYRSAGEGGAWGIALLALFTARKAEEKTVDYKNVEGKVELSLEEFLEEGVFGRNAERVVEQPDQALATKFTAYLNEYRGSLAVERAAIESLKKNESLKEEVSL